MYINPKKKKKLMKKRMNEEKFIRNYPDLYTKYSGMGFTKPKAVTMMKRELTQKKTKKGTKTLLKLQQRYQLTKDKPKVQAISIEDIPRTKAVNEWIEDKVSAGSLIDLGYQLKFSKDESLGRY